MFELCVKSDFPAAHRLNGYPGDCARPHGHNFGVEVYVRTLGLDALGMAVDFRTLKGAIKEIIGAWDHQDLNTFPEFEKINPTAENIAQVLFKKLKPLTDQCRCSIHRITVSENASYSATYFGPSL